MEKEEIRAIALEVKGRTYPDWNVSIDRYLEEFASRFLAAIAEKENPVAWSITIDGEHSGNFWRLESVARERMNLLMRAYPEHKRAVVPLYTHPATVLTSPAILPASTVAVR